MEKRRILVCSAWPYASGIPHLGNLVSSLLSGDVFTRYYRMRGHEVCYVSGTDAHGTRIEFEASKKGITPAEFAAATHEKILAVIDGFGISFDTYTTTESPVHKAFVRETYEQIEKKGYIHSQEEDRPYCANCQIFLADRFITGTCPRCGAASVLGDQCDLCGAMLEPKELVSPSCSYCRKQEIEFRPTRHWYLDLARLSPRLVDYVASRRFQGNVHQFTQSMLDEGLRARAMTRDIAWGIPAPFAGAEGKVIYVWGEAVLGYVSATIERFRGGEEWKAYWFGDDVHQIYTIGKDNIPFHTLIFPGLLIASGREYHLPDQIAATEHLNWIGGEKFSKSRGVGLYCDEALRLMDPELWRFYLLYNRPETHDVNFSWQELDKAVNGVLISNVANLANRVLSFIQTRYDRVVPAESVDPEIALQLERAISACEQAVEAGALSQALRAVCGLAVVGNEYFQRKKPWESGDAAAVGSAFHLVKGMAVLLFPFVPGFSSRILAAMGVSSPRWEELARSSGGKRLSGERVLLERVDVEALAKQVTGRRRERVSLEEFGRAEFRVGTIRGVAEVPGAEKLYQLTIDLGDARATTVSGIRGPYSPDRLLGRQVAVLANLEPSRIRGIASECMLLVAKGEHLALLVPDHEVAPGTPIG